MLMLAMILVPLYAEGFVARRHTLPAAHFACRSPPYPAKAAGRTPRSPPYPAKAAGRALRLPPAAIPRRPRTSPAVCLRQPAAHPARRHTPPTAHFACRTPRMSPAAGRALRLPLAATPRSPPHPPAAHFACLRQPAAHLPAISRRTPSCDILHVFYMDLLFL